jgi:hypothetical protein
MPVAAPFGGRLGSCALRRDVLRLKVAAAFGRVPAGPGAPMDVCTASSITPTFRYLERGEYQPSRADRRRPSRTVRGDRKGGGRFCLRRALDHARLPKARPPWTSHRTDERSIALKLNPEGKFRAPSIGWDEPRKGDKLEVALVKGRWVLPHPGRTAASAGAARTLLPDRLSDGVSLSGDRSRFCVGVSDVVTDDATTLP